MVRFKAPLNYFPIQNISLKSCLSNVNNIQIIKPPDTKHLFTLTGKFIAGDKTTFNLRPNRKLVERLYHASSLCYLWSLFLMCGFILTFPQAKLKVDIFMELYVGFNLVVNEPFWILVELLCKYTLSWKLTSYTKQMTCISLTNIWIMS